MFKRKYLEKAENCTKRSCDEKIDFSGTDILAFIIAFFQVLFPYVVGTLISFTVVAFILSQWMK